MFKNDQMYCEQCVTCKPRAIHHPPLHILSNLVLVFKDVLYSRAAPLPLHHPALLSLGHSGSICCGAQRHLMSGVGAGPPPPLSSGEPVPAVGPGRPHHPGPAHDPAAPPPDDRSVHSAPSCWRSCCDCTVVRNIGQC